MRVLYAGDSPVGGASNYLLGVLRAMRAQVLHIPPSVVLRPRDLARRYDAVIFSDFPAHRAPLVAQQVLARQIRDGTGLLMVGGWASFSGLQGGWRGSVIEELLPVLCLKRDDRVALSGGAIVLPTRRHPLLRGVSFVHPPVICGFNRVRPRARSLVLLEARQLLYTTTRSGRPPHLALNPAGVPLLIVDSRPSRRVAALMTDLAPHWCGGLVDWGPRRVVLSVHGRLRIEVGTRYVQFVSNLVRWLAGYLDAEGPLSGR